MKRLLNLIAVIFFLSCSQSDSNRTVTYPDNNSSQKDTIKNIAVNEKNTAVFKKTEEIADTAIKRKTDTALLLNVSAAILKAIKKRDYNKFISFIHPEYAVRFSPYAYIDTADNQILSKTKLIQLAKQNERINWSTSWDRTPELLTIHQYFKKFVYDVDFLYAPVKSVNEFHSQGTDLNNITEVYPGCDIVEFYFPGFEEKYGGMDFRGLRLVFKFYKKKLYLIAIVHDEWTP